MIAKGHVHLDKAHTTPQFWLLWLVLTMNVSAGIGIIGAAAPMLQETFGGYLIGAPDLGYAAVKADKDLLAKMAIIAAGFVGLFSLLNIIGRFVWASLSDYFGRKNTYYIFFILGIAMYLTAAYAADQKVVGLFAVTMCVIASMYGGGFSTIPAYLADLFGTQFVGAIHGRLLTAWSTAGILGPLLVNYLHDTRQEAHVPVDQIYSSIFYVLAGLLIVGMIANFLVRPVAADKFMTPEELSDAKQKAHEAAAATQAGQHTGASLELAGTGWVIFGWLVVGIPLAYGIYMTLLKAAKLF